MAKNVQFLENCFLNFGPESGKMSERQRSEQRFNN